MIKGPDRLEAMRLINEAVAAGARQALACDMLGLSVRTVQRWRHTPQDRRSDAPHHSPANKLSESERTALLVAANRHDYASMTPHQIVPKLADEGIYLASESTFYRVMKAAG
ncbi:Homeodomain-like domain-containing protein [Sulfurirhabdus autotrophica]|uniref:Homeodomain-like domain-containing protein n=1 Tax=Sulfurirhabdus autotrophica TaxID=1706046 RepID=A0A4V2W0S1_9PROT|nr:Homeodomain-like domain-containing protein [Sulfurirhabdus autotrophica]